MSARGNDRGRGRRSQLELGAAKRYLMNSIAWYTASSTTVDCRVHAPGPQCGGRGPPRGMGAMANEIIGRRDELLALESFLEAAPAGGQSVLIEGDAGIGKTVLWQEALRIAGDRDFCVLRSRPTQSEAQVAFAAVGDL